jgi:hypothetical protein
MQSASIQQPINRPNGKGMASSATSGPRGDFGDPNFDNSHVMPPRFRSMSDQLMGGQFTQGPSNNGQWDPTEGGGFNPYGGAPQQDNMAAPAVMPSRQYTQQQPQGKGGRNVTMPGQGGQPRMGMPNAYSNTIQPWDNASIQPQAKSGKGKG